MPPKRFEPAIISDPYHDDTAGMEEDSHGEYVLAKDYYNDTEQLKKEKAKSGVQARKDMQPFIEELQKSLASEEAENEALIVQCSLDHDNGVFDKMVTLAVTRGSRIKVLPVISLTASTILRMSASLKFGVVWAFAKDMPRIQTTRVVVSLIVSDMFIKSLIT